MKNIFAIIGIATVFIYAIGSSLWVNTGDNWYRNLISPSWQPPDFIFGIIWPYNFIVLGIAAVIIARRSSTTSTILYLTLFAVSVACALIWAYQFYVPHNLQVAAIALVGTAIITIPMMVIAFKTSAPLGLALLPYQAWVGTAATLSYTYARLN